MFRLEWGSHPPRAAERALQGSACSVLGLELPPAHGMLLSHVCGFHNPGPSLPAGNCVKESWVWPSLERPPGSSSPTGASASYCLSRENVYPETWGSPGLSGREHPDLEGQLHPTTEPPRNRAGWYCGHTMGSLRPEWDWGCGACLRRSEWETALGPQGGGSTYSDPVPGNRGSWLCLVLFFSLKVT